jgi:hypothetical protein
MAAADREKKQRRLSHSGVALPMPCERQGAPPVLWKGRPLDLSCEAEEMITEFVRRGGRSGSEARSARLFGSAAAAEAFWGDWRRLLPPGSRVGGLGELDLRGVRAHLAKQAHKNGKGKNSKDKNSKGNRGDAGAAEVDAPRPRHSAVALVDGVPHQVVPPAVDRPGIFTGKGAEGKSAFTGRLRRRVAAREVVLNLSEDARVPAVPLPKCASSVALESGTKSRSKSMSKSKTKPGCSWGGVVHEPDADWIAKWRDPLTGVVKYARLRRPPSERAKYELAWRVARALPAFRAEVSKMLARPGRGKAAQRERQLGAALWLVDRLAMRVGSGSAMSAEAAGAHGATTLLCRHVRLPVPSNTKGVALVTLDFPGKDGVRYVRSLAATGGAEDEEGGVDARAASAVLAACSRRGASGSQLFPLAGAADVNAAIARLLPPGATSKVVRTAGACTLFKRSLADMLPPAPASVEPHAHSDAKEAVPHAPSIAALALLIAGARVAVLCNHRRALRSQQKEAPPDLRELDDELVAAQATARALIRGNDEKSEKATEEMLGALARWVKRDLVGRARLSLSTARSDYLDPRIAAGLLRERLGLPPQDAFPRSLADRFAWAVQEVQGKA